MVKKVQLTESTVIEGIFVQNVLEWSADPEMKKVLGRVEKKKKKEKKKPEKMGKPSRRFDSNSGNPALSLRSHQKMLLFLRYRVQLWDRKNGVPILEKRD
uniref:Uncharacterized protein n=1 Tax=Vespula pensylvanica TaxID=30213 RepID=A0A834PCL0_VESPE|nr:hypothetical protein H0235_003823 [Vespula pensylvanica]